MQIVRKLRTPRGPSVPAYRCPTELQKTISLSKYDEVVSPIRGSGASIANTTQWRDNLAMPQSCANTSTKDAFAPMYRFYDNTSMPSIGSVPRTAKRSASAERVYKCLGKISGAKKRLNAMSSKRQERFTNRILQFIGDMTFSEKHIRQALGDNPDTSKALRM